MPDEIGGFQTAGTTWAQRAETGELSAVLSPTGPERSNRFVHATQLAVARIAADLLPRKAAVLDFGCGTGRFLRYFGAKNHRIIGTEITLEMLREARKFGLPPRALLVRTDGVAIPAESSSIDLIWCCTVLRYSLLVPNPVYADIAREMFRVLRPGGFVVDLEMYVHNPPETFTRDFEAAGFRTRSVRIVHRWTGLLERALQLPFVPEWSMPLAGRVCAAARLLLDDAHRDVPGLRDYLFLFAKPGGDAAPRKATP